MPKAVLIMDMPESCPDCRFFESDWSECYAISKQYNRDVMTEGAKPDWCPLRELPKHRRTIGNVSEGKKLLMNAGFNDCLDEISGEKSV